MDKIDQEIISVLQQDGRRAYSKIAEDLEISESVVRYRVQRLEKSGVLQIVGIADPLKIGFDLMALVGIGIAPGKLRDVAGVLSQLPEASYVARTAGRFDMIVEVVCRNTEHFAALLSDKIQMTDGVTRTESFLILGIDKMAYGWGVTPISDPFADGADGVLDGQPAGTIDGPA